MVWASAGNLPEQNKSNECVNRPPGTAVKKYTGTYDLPCTRLQRCGRDAPAEQRCRMIPTEKLILMPPACPCVYFYHMLLSHPFRGLKPQLPEHFIRHTFPVPFPKRIIQFFFRDIMADLFLREILQVFFPLPFFSSASLKKDSRPVISSSFSVLRPKRSWFASRICPIRFS